MRKPTSLLALAGLGTVAIGIIAIACGAESSSKFADPNGHGDGGPGTGFGPGGDGSTRGVTSLKIDPTTAALDVTSAPFPTQQFTATATYDDGSSGVAPASWSVTNAPVGSIDSSGLYTPRGGQGGVVTVTASLGGQTATATLTVKLHQMDNPANADAATQAGLLGATAADGAIVWTYPYDGMAYARGLNAPELMWNGSGLFDVYGIHIQSATYELTTFATGLPVFSTAGSTPSGARAFDFDAARWAAFVSSTSGDATVTITRKSGSAYTKVVEQTWKIASRSMSGTIYYWAINKGAVVRIKPGAAGPDPFLLFATVLTPEADDTGTKSTKMFCPSCHTVSADGSTLAMGTGEWDPAIDVWSTVYNLKTNATVFQGYNLTDSPPTRYPLAGLTPDGKVLVENWAQVRGPSMAKDDVPVDLSSLSGTTASFLSGTDLDTLVGAGSGHHTLFPAFSADNALFTYVDSMTLELYTLDWNPTTKKFANKVKMAAAPVSGKIAYPTISPDHRWIVYQVGPDYGSLNTDYLGDLYAIDTKNPMTPIALGAINTTMSAAATTSRDQHRSYEPAFAPAASGGYFWLVFHSRRTYGNRLLDVPFNGEGHGTKQLWVAAIDVAGANAVTTDPSHPPFWLPGQDQTTLNMRGYWALDPCHQDGQSCSNGTDCCNGFCDATNDAGAAVCGKSAAGCSQPGDRCESAADCCDVGSGVMCINHVCSEAPPR
jgi:hypothetical protein